MQKKESTTQNKTEAAAATSTVTSTTQQSLAPPPFQLKASDIVQEKQEADMSSNFLGMSAAGDTPNGGSVSSPNNRGNSNTSQRKQAITPFQAPVQQKVAPTSSPPFQAPVQKKAATDTIPPFQAPVQKKSGAGNIPEDVRGKMENAFQADFSNVNVHQNSQSATDVGALAYTQGNDVHFAPGQFKPDTNAGQELIGHELTHVVQQREGRVKPTTQAKGMPVNDNPDLEQEADVMGRKAAATTQMKTASLGTSTANRSSSTTTSATAQMRMTPKKKKFYEEIAVKLLNGLTSEGISQEKAYFVVAQVLQENGWGTDAPPGNNYFNIKGSTDLGSVRVTTHEEDAAGNRTQIEDDFRVYEDLASSMADYIALLQTNFPDAYDALTNNEKGIADFVAGLANGTKGRYATDADYSEMVTILANQVGREFMTAVPDYQPPTKEEVLPLIYPEHISPAIDNTYVHHPLIYPELDAQTEETPARSEETMRRVDMDRSPNSPAYNRWQHNGAASSHSTDFDAEFLVQSKAFFGEELTHEQILAKINTAQTAGNVEEAERLRKLLFRANQYAIVESLDVENDSLYQRNGAATYCNVYAYDVVTALGAYLPRLWWTADYEDKITNNEVDENEVDIVYGQGVTKEMRANHLNDWVREYGEHFGWREASSMKAAQDAANDGNVVILLASHIVVNSPGHINVILAETDQHKAKEHTDGTTLPLQSQAGGTNFKYDTYSHATNPKWWENATHELGAAWIHDGVPNSPILTPEEIGLANPSTTSTTDTPSNTATKTSGTTPEASQPKSSNTAHPLTTTGRPPTHKVIRGDSYSKIARQYDISVDDLKRWNEYSDTSIPVGAEILLDDPNRTKEDNTPPAEFRKSAQAVEDSEKLQQIREALSAFNVDEPKVIQMLGQLSMSEKMTVLLRETTYLQPMSAAFNVDEMMKALQILSSNDAYFAVKWLFESSSWYNSLSAQQIIVFLQNSSLEGLQKIANDPDMVKKLIGVAVGEMDMTALKTISAILNSDNLAMENATGISAEESIQGSTQGFYTLRSEPFVNSPSVVKMGELNGENMDTTVTDKVVSDGYTWYHVYFKNAAQYASVIDEELINESNNVNAKAMVAKQSAWVIKEGLTLIVSYEQLLRQVRAFDEAHASLSVKERVIKLRQMSHGEELIFDHVLGRNTGTYYENQRPSIEGLHQLMLGPKAARLPTGEVVDIYHFLVGLDALEPDNERVEKRRVYGINIGSSYAAATWSGDIGAGVMDKFLNGKKDNDLHEEKFKEEEKAAAENNESYDREARRLDFYFDSRAPSADLLADIDSWGAYEMVTNPEVTSLEMLLTNYYGAATDTGGLTLQQTRKTAITNFLTNYNFTSATGLSGQSDALQHMADEIYNFAYIWLWQRDFWEFLNATERKKLKEDSRLMAIKLLDWLEKLAADYQVTLE